MTQPTLIGRLGQLVGGHHRKLLFVAGDGVVVVLSLLAAVWLRYDGDIQPSVWAQVPLVVAIALVVKLAVFMTQGLYALSWAQVGLEDVLAVVRGVTLGSIALWAIVFPLKWAEVLSGFPRSVLLLDYIITLHAIVSFRMGRRVYQHLVHSPSTGGRAALIVGAGAAGTQLARSLWHTPTSGYAPVGFVDDDAGKRGTVIQGLRVLGDREHLPAIVHQHSIEAILVALPSASSRVIRNVISLARAAGVREIRIVPTLDRIINGKISFTDLEEVQLTDLLGRQVVHIDTAAVGRWLGDQTVLVTGAGGSIGGELCRQIARFHPREIALLDWDETGLFWAEQEMHRINQRATTVLADVRDRGRIRQVLHDVRPRTVFHAAAYKHVGLMERHPAEAVAMNILGTLSVAQASADEQVEKFVLISTDKAVNPTSVYGAAKRVAEQICLVLNGQGGTRHLAVRFGNVLGSRGSVIPLFQDNIRRGEPITVRGPYMRRYFMATSEAVLLVLQAGAMGQGGEIFVLDMGEPVRIIDLAKELIRLSGLEPDKDVPIIFADPEPGEKEFEDLLTVEEGTVATRYDRIFVARGALPVFPELLFERVSRLEECVRAHELSGIIRSLQELVPTYRPSEWLLSQLDGARLG